VSGQEHASQLTSEQAQAVLDLARERTRPPPAEPQGPPPDDSHGAAPAPCDVCGVVGHHEPGCPEVQS
jgi:hypothetical protein